MKYTEKLFFSPARSLIRVLLIIIGISMILWSWWKSFDSNSEKNIFLLVDNSFSMSVQDTMLENQILFSRLDVVKKISKNIIEKNNFPLAIATFSREMQIHLPLSSDIFLQENVINGISLHQYGGGSDLYKAISRISEIYKNHKNLHIIVFSDMEFFEEKTNNFSIPKNFHIDFVWIGSENGGHMLEWYSSDGSPVYRKFQWQNAVSVMNAEKWKSLAEEFWWQFLHINNEKSLNETTNILLNTHISSAKNIDFIKILAVIILLFGIFLPIYAPVQKSS